MLNEKDRIRLRHMLDYSREAVEIAKEATRADLDTNRVLELALVRLLELVGEAAGRVSPGVQASFSEVPWSLIVGMRNRLIHGYDAVDHDVLWDTLSDDLPRLIDELEKIVSPEPQ